MSHVPTPATSPEGPLTDSPAGSSAPTATAQRQLPLGRTVAALAIVLVATVAAAVCVGSVGVDLSTVTSVVWHRVGGQAPTASAIDDQIVWNLRMPRVLLAIVIGAGLALVGATLQATVRNPLADPYVLGVSAGAGLLASISITLGSAAVAGFSTSAAAFVGALAATVAVLVLAQRAGRFAPGRLVLAGVTLSYLFTGLTSFVIFRSDDAAASQSVLFWLLGSLGQAAWSNLAIPTAVVLAGAAYLLARARTLDALVLGDDTALSLGIAVHRARWLLLVTTSLITGVLVAVAGGIGFVGLIIPHLVRIVAGPEHRRVLPIAALVGAIYLVAVDLLCRVAVRPAELPVGIVTSIIGAPVFLWLLRRTETTR